MFDKLADVLRDGLFVFLITVAGLLALLLFLLVLQRGVRTFRFRRTARLERRYGVAIDALFRETGPWSGAALLIRAPARHRRIIAKLLSRPLRVLSGESVTRARDAAALVGLTSVWNHDLTERRWWRRAEAALALGLMRDPAVYNDLIGLLDDPHDEVRSASVESLGRLGDLRAVPALLDRLSQQTLHQPARIIDAVSMLGPSGAPALLDHARRHPEQLPMLTGLLASIGGASVVPDLLQWVSFPLAATRAAAFDALGTVGLDDRSFYYALRALRDPDEEVRAMAARALGRNGREDGAPYLAECLDDEWVVAAQAARALALLGDAGLAVLVARSRVEGDEAGVASQMLWEHARGTR
ncbi:MAG: HEAT repeat domain-containing protein [Acidobacteriota bacterium]|nr:HEAT repeat domain-containing protein [Acidobacteriota bacterium]